MKHQVGERIHGFECECDADAHQSFNTKCPITVAVLYQTAVAEDVKYIKNFTRTDMKKATDRFGDPYFRRLTFKRNAHQNGKKGKDRTEKYFMWQQWGASKMRDSLKYLNDKLGLSVKLGTNRFADKNKNKKNFTGHSGRLSLIRNIEIKYGDDLKDQEKLAISGHKSMITWNRYCDKGK